MEDLTDGIRGDRSDEEVKDRYIILGKGGDSKWQDGLPKGGEGSEVIDLAEWTDFVGGLREGVKLSDLAKDGGASKKIQDFIEKVEKYTERVEKAAEYGEKFLDATKKELPPDVNTTPNPPKKPDTIIIDIFNKYGNKENTPWKDGQSRTVSEAERDSVDKDGKLYRIKRVYKKQ